MAGLSFNRRVHVVAEVLERPEELGLLQQVCESMEWPVREPLAGEAVVTADAGWTLRVIEVRIRGARETAVEQAVVMLDTLLQSVELSVHCRDATLVERNRKSQVEWRLRGRRGSVSRLLHNALHVAYRTGDHDPHTGTVRLVRIPATLDESRQRRLARTRRTARAVLTHHPLVTRRLNPDVHELGRPSVSWRGHVFALLMLIVVLAAICLLGSGSWSEIGADSPRVGSPLVILIGGYLLGGTALAIRRTPTHRAVPWLVPLAVPLAVPLVPWLGTLVQRAYLSAFGLRPVAGEGGMSGVQAGLWILCVFFVASLLPVAFLGWMQFLAPSLRAQRVWLSWAPALAAGIGLGLVLSLSILVDAQRSGAEHRALAVAGQDIPEYFEVRAEYACVEPTSAEAPYYGASPPRDHPVVIFGQSGDRVEFWDPGARHKTNIRLEDARIRFVPHSDSQCIKSTR